MNKVDVSIAGGGIAGLCLSIILAKKGFKVMVFEKNTYPMHKLCGEYISLESKPFLQDDLSFDFSKHQIPNISKLKISSPSGNVISHKLQPGGLGMSRYMLDHELSIIAQNAGVHLLTNAKVENISFNGTEYYTKISNIEEPFRSTLAVGTWGKRANMDMVLNREFVRTKHKAHCNYVAVKYHLKSELPLDTIELHNFDDGYCGISAVENGVHCLCYLTTSKKLMQNDGKIVLLEQNILMKNPFLKKYLSESEKIFKQPIAISQINFEHKNLADGHIIMAGDAAGMIAPLCGNGMSMAMHTAKILGVLVPEFMSGNLSFDLFVNRYQQVWNKNFKTRLMAGRVFQSLFGSVFITEGVIAMLKPFPKLVSKLVSLTHGSENIYL